MMADCQPIGEKGPQAGERGEGKMFGDEPATQNISFVSKSGDTVDACEILHQLVL